MRDLFKDTSLVKENGSLKRKEIRRRKEPSTRRDSNPQPPGYKACALPLCYNRGPALTTGITDEHVGAVAGGAFGVSAVLGLEIGQLGRVGTSLKQI